jgi:hypothetical protein
MTRLLIDECLSAELALIARERGHHEASHVVWIGKSGWKDWDLKQVLLDEDWVLVTWNCKDFRGPKNAPGSKGVLADVPLHAGLVCTSKGRLGWTWNFNGFSSCMSSKSSITTPTLRIRSWKSASTIGVKA